MARLERFRIQIGMAIGSPACARTFCPHGTKFKHQSMVHALECGGHEETSQRNVSVRYRVTGVGRERSPPQSIERGSRMAI